MSALKQLLHQIVDYAGLFPPAGLPLETVVGNYARYLAGPQRWMLARLIVPAQRLEELARIHERLDTRSEQSRVWKISALIPAVEAEDEAFRRAVEAIQDFNTRHRFAVVDTVEGKLSGPERVDETCRGLAEIPAGFLAVFLEIPHSAAPPSIGALAACERPRTFAKIRTGGVTPDLIPAAETVAGFVCDCARAGLGFKATAGLHHPFPGQYALTYESGSPHSGMHGFVNVFVAACLAQHRQWDKQQVTELLQDRDSRSFCVTDEHVSWQDHTVSASEIHATRQQFAISFGSCSFDEPVQDLVQAGWLAAAAKTF
jgi:hypothetical protein